jgi:hypothetical protein
MEGPILLTPIRIFQAGTEIAKVGLRTKRTISVLAGTAGPAHTIFVKAAETVGSVAGEHIGHAAAHYTARAFGASVVVGGKVTIPLLAAGLITTATLWRTGKNLAKKEWKLAAAEFGVGMLEAGVNIAFMPVPAVGLLLGEALRQGAVEILARKTGVRAENAGLYNLYHTVRHVIDLRKARKRGLPPAQSLLPTHCIPV